MAQLADAYLEKHLKANVPSWFADQRLISTHIKPALGRSPLAEVTQMDLTSLGRRTGRRFPADARRLRALLSGMFDWAEEHGLWSRSSRKRAAAKGAPEPRPKAKPKAGAKSKARSRTKPRPKAAPPPTAEELAESLRRSEEQRRELAARLEEVSSSGVEMLAKLNQQAADQRELEAELGRSRRELARAHAEAEGWPDPAKARKQVANLRQSVEQLMDSLNEAQSERQEMAERLAAAEAKARTQSEKVIALSRLRSELGAQAREEERKAAIRKVQRRTDEGRRNGVTWLAAGLIGGVLVTLLLQKALGPDQVPAAPSAGRPGTAVAATGAEGVDPARTEPAPPASAAAEEAGLHSQPATETSEVAAVTPDPRPDPADADAAVREWAAAWSEQRVDDYLSAYSVEFDPPGGLQRGEWAAQRQSRILRPASIRVTLGTLNRTVIDAERVRVSFEQSYETETYSDQVVKTLELVWEEDGWKIAVERAG